jgi:hypothetical protein
MRSGTEDGHADSASLEVGKSIETKKHNRDYWDCIEELSGVEVMV